MKHIMGYPRIGKNRELKKALERYWKGELDCEGLMGVGKAIRLGNYQKQMEGGMDLVCCNDFSFYDHVLDMSGVLGYMPERFGYEKEVVGFDGLFMMARGFEGVDASRMKKWFGTNYHYIVPELGLRRKRENFRGVLEGIEEVKNLGGKGKVVLLGPLTYSHLSDYEGGGIEGRVYDEILESYSHLLEGIEKQGVEWVQMDEPIFSLDMDGVLKKKAVEGYEVLAKVKGGLKILLSNYYGDLRGNRDVFYGLSVEGHHIDFCMEGDIERVLEGFPKGRVCSMGLVNGREVWKNDLKKSIEKIERVKGHGGYRIEELMVATSCSLMHVPVSLEGEDELDEEVKSWLSFADEKIEEVRILGDYVMGKDIGEELDRNMGVMESRRRSGKVRILGMEEEYRLEEGLEVGRGMEYGERRKLWKNGVGDLLTTTIGSFPQTKELRKERAMWKRGELSQGEYEGRIKARIQELVEFQEGVGLDILVHGEFERNDMVEYFGLQLKGYGFTKNGWVQSYGSRCVKPPILYGDIAREEGMTVEWIRYAQGLTKKPVKGMLTGPITMLQWSFLRDDVSKKEMARQMAMALRKEVLELEGAGIEIIQIDEPGLREGLPLRREDWEEYLGWAVDSFQRAYTGVKEATQIHTHMCYADFKDIISAILKMDADVLYIEAARAEDLCEEFASAGYRNGLGVGVYDVHSPFIAGIGVMRERIKRSLKSIDRGNIWINPDCGLKTRGWEETKESLKNMVLAVNDMR